MAKTQGPTYQPSKIRRIRKFGYLKRNESSDGIKVVKRRIAKGRYKISASQDFGTTKTEKNKRFGRRR